MKPPHPALRATLSPKGARVQLQIVSTLSLLVENGISSMFASPRSLG
jgi:hypothetical protein